MIRSALIALGLSAEAAQGHGLANTTPMFEIDGGMRLILTSSSVAPDETRMGDVEKAASPGICDLFALRRLKDALFPHILLSTAPWPETSPTGRRSHA